jgi:hypothetical protein
MARVFLYMELIKLSSRSKMITKTIESSKIAIYDKVNFQYKNDLKGFWSYHTKLYEVYAYNKKTNDNVLIAKYFPISSQWVIIYNKDCIKYYNIVNDAINTPRERISDR